ncbi:response regulator transcription factor [Blautia sp.]|uniref:response regulator transcription factor n=1 Tax=Blautia sp. TaxID=1955243 RepID=UPI00258A8B59|nr:response regulator [Blautia sp.]
MLRVLLVDDEQVIVQGLMALIDWEKEGFVIAGTASDGKEALRFIEHIRVDLIMADINMPEISGLQLLQKIRTEKLSDAFFIILSGFAEFSYAQEAIRYKCTDYILKPIKKEQLMDTLHKISEMTADKEARNRTNRKMEREYLARNLIAVIKGKYDEVNLEIIREQVCFEGSIRYVEIELNENLLDEEIADEEKRTYQRRLSEVCADYLGDYADHCVFDVSGKENIYDIGFVYCDYIAEKDFRTEKNYLENFLAYLREEADLPVIMLVGKKVDDIQNIAKSYSTACILRSCQGFKNLKDIYYYDEEIQVSGSGVVLCKKEIDALLQSIEQNQETEIVKNVDDFFEEIQKMGVGGDKSLNIDYLLFQLIHLATQQDDNVNQEEILRLISEQSFKEGLTRGSKAHLLRFSREYALYLAQLRQNVSGGILTEIEKEIRTHFAENLTLKGLSEKYYVNSAYLGQLFRKKYGCSFKDYLNRTRIDAAAFQLVQTDKKIYQIAEEAGYHNLDYFVSRFIDAKGITPAKYRRNARI